MAKIRELKNSKRDSTIRYLVFMCPGCNEEHQFNDKTWKFDGDMDKPTLSPSYLIRGKGHYKRPDGRGDLEYDHIPWLCHSYIKQGKIQFLGDCTHDLKNQTVELKDY